MTCIGSLLILLFLPLLIVIQQAKPLLAPLHVWHRCFIELHVCVRTKMRLYLIGY